MFRLTYDQAYRFKYQPGPRGNWGRCHLRVYQSDQPGQKPIIIATELEHNPGMSVTNAAQHIAEQVRKDRTIWDASQPVPLFASVNDIPFRMFEHYQGALPASRYPDRLKRAPEETWCEIILSYHPTEKRLFVDDNFARIIQPSPWRHCLRETVEDAIGMGFPDVPDPKLPDDEY